MKANNEIRFIVLASIVLSTLLGSIHSFSVFTPQWESMQGANRSNVSLIYSIALVSLTAAVLFGYRVFKYLSPFAVFVTVGILASLGLVLSAYAARLVTLYFTYGIVFGFANGLGYGYVLQLTGQAAKSYRGLAMGLVTAFYAVGATLSPLIFNVLIGSGGNELALKTFAGLLLVLALGCAVIVRYCNAQFQHESPEQSLNSTANLYCTKFLLWLGYGFAVLAGLMVIGHAYGIALWSGISLQRAALAASVVAFGNMVGGFSIGFIADRSSSLLLLCLLPLVSALGLLLLNIAVGGTVYSVLLGLLLIGYSYGAIIAVYPVAVSEIFGIFAAPRVYGQIFTAWGLAGLLGPWLSGWMFDQTQSYSTALVIAAVLGVFSSIAISLCARLQNS